MSANTCSGCPAFWTGVNIAHCAACHETFSTVGNFDKHRSDGVCVDPRTIPSLEIRGIVWRGRVSEKARAAIAAMRARPRTASNADLVPPSPQLDPSDAPGASEAVSS